MRYQSFPSGLLFAILIYCAQGVIADTDWPQFLHDSYHTGDAGMDDVTAQWHWSMAVSLEDSVLTSPIIKDGKVYVVDQMGTAYQVDPQAGSIVWQTKPPGVDLVGGNTSTPCWLDGKLAYGTTSGHFCLLDCKEGHVLAQTNFGHPILGAITTANDCFYFQTLDGVIHCLSSSAEIKWSFDPYRDAPTDPGSRDIRQYCGVSVAVRDTRLVAAVGFDIVGLECFDDRAEMTWKLRRPMKDTFLPSGISLDDRWAYVSLPGKDGLGALIRIEHSNGVWERSRDSIDEQWAIRDAPSNRDGVSFVCRQAFGLSSIPFSPNPRVQWSTFDENPNTFIPANASPILVGTKLFLRDATGDW